MSKFIKEKNFILMYIGDKDKPYRYDMNNGKIYGLTGNELKNMPCGLSKALKEMAMADLPLPMQMIYSYHRYGGYALADSFHNSRTAIPILDKLSALNISIDLNSYIWWRNDRWEYIQQHWNSLIKYMKDMGLTTITPNLTEDYERAMVYGEVRRKCNAPNLADDHARLILNSDFTDEEMPIVAYWLTHGMWELYNDMVNGYRWVAKIKEYLFACRYMEIEPDKKNFMRSYGEVMQAYREVKDQAKNARIKEYQTKRNLHFEDENYIVVVPTTNQELVNEGNAQGNCVGGYGDYIAKGERNVVFVRGKSMPASPYITVDISSHGSIHQYYMAYNNRVDNPSAISFRRKYQDYLDSIW